LADATDDGVVAAARRLGVIGDQGGFDDLVELGSERSEGLLRERARVVGSIIDLLVDVIDPELVIVAGGALPDYLVEIRSAVATQEKRGWDARRIIATGLGKDILVTSSAAIILADYFHDPLRFEDLGQDVA
jgi:predicted NBD/HSP70 family sugar kinase